MSEQKKIRRDCPCPRVHCPRHGDCVACAAYHRTESKFPVACRREKQEKRSQ